MSWTLLLSDRPRHEPDRFAKCFRFHRWSTINGWCTSTDSPLVITARKRSLPESGLGWRLIFPKQTKRPLDIAPWLESSAERAKRKAEAKHGQQAAYVAAIASAHRSHKQEVLGG